MPYWLGLTLVFIGFFITAAGVPISSFGLFAFLVRLCRTYRAGWVIAAAVSGMATALGHLGSLVAFRFYGSTLKARLERFFPIGDNELGAIEERVFRTWPVTFFLRWLGGGYSQVFWLAGMTSGPLERLVVPFVLNDFLWAAFWCFAITTFSDRVPVLEYWLTVTGIAAMVITPVTMYFAAKRHASSHAGVVRER